MKIRQITISIIVSLLLTSTVMQAQQSPPRKLKKQIKEECLLEVPSNRTYRDAAEGKTMAANEIQIFDGDLDHKTYMKYGTVKVLELEASYLLREIKKLEKSDDPNAEWKISQLEKGFKVLSKGSAEKVKELKNILGMQAYNCKFSADRGM